MNQHSTPARTPPGRHRPRRCVFCTLMQAFGRLLSVLFVPRVLAFLISALGLLALMMASGPNLASSANPALTVPDRPSAVSAVAPSVAASNNPLRFAIVTSLPNGRVGELWKSRQMLELGQPPYVLSFVGTQPAWITEYAAGTLSGTPDKEGFYVFTLRGTSKTNPGQSVEQSFSLRVLPRRNPDAKPAAAVASVPTGPIAIKTERYTPQTFRLEKADIGIDPPADDESEVDVGDELSKELPPALPDLNPWQKMLEPLLGIDYPSEAQFRSALKLAHCHAYQALLDTQKSKPTSGKTTSGLSSVAPSATALSELAANKCKAPDVPVLNANARIDPALGCATGLLAPLTTFETLLPPAVRECLVERAQRLHRLDDFLPTRWEAKPGCACLPMSDPDNPDEVYGFINAWGSVARQEDWAASQAKAEAEAKAAGLEPKKLRPEWVSVQLNYSLYSRLSYLGAVLRDDGSYAFSDSVKAEGRQLAEVALRHRTETDLVIYRNDWRILTDEKWQPDATASYIELAASRAVDLLDTPAEHGPNQRLTTLLPRFWREGQWAFTGLTIFFDNAPRVGTAEGKRYAAFLHTFMTKVIEKMQAKGRPYRLNLVVPGEQVGEEGAYQFSQQLAWVQAAEPSDVSGHEREKYRGRYQGSTPIAVRYIVLLSDPPTESKKKLRAIFDSAVSVHGDDRVALLRRTLPMLQRPPAVSQPAWLSNSSLDQWADDLAYMKWSFNGVALWDAPAETENDQALLALLGKVFRPDQNADDKQASPFQWLADTVCLHRVASRLLWLATVVLGSLAILLWMFNCSVRRRGAPYQRFLQIGAVGFMVLSSALMVYDPVVVQWAGNYLLIWLLAMVIVTTSFIVKVNPKGNSSS